MAVAVGSKNTWDHYPSDEELAALVIDPVDHKDQHGNQYTPIAYATGSRIPMICTCCERDFTEGGWYNYAPRGRELFRILVCPDHTMVRALMDEDAEEEMPAL